MVSCVRESSIRIDKDTTGALLVCKNDNAHRDLALQLKEHSIKRRYRAIVAGVIKEEEGTIEGPIGRHPVDRKKMAINYKNGKEAVTHYRVLERFPNATYVECRLETGRTHQIRVHMTSIGHPLLGDEVYGSGEESLPSSGSDSSCHDSWDLCIHLQENIWSLQHLYQNILRSFWKNSRK